PDPGGPLRFERGHGLTRSVRLDADAPPPARRGKSRQDGGADDFPVGVVHLPGNFCGPRRTRGPGDCQSTVEEVGRTLLSGGFPPDSNARPRTGPSLVWFDRKGAGDGHGCLVDPAGFEAHVWGETRMKGFIARTVSAVGLACGGLAAAGGCYGYKDLVDPCYPQRYWFSSRQLVREHFAPQVNNGHILDQTVWNYHFEPGKAVLTPGGMEHL